MGPLLLTAAALLSPALTTVHPGASDERETTPSGTYRIVMLSKIMLEIAVIVINMIG